MALTHGGACVAGCGWEAHANYSTRDRFKKHYMAHMEVDQHPAAAKALRQIKALEELEERVEYPTIEQINEAVENA